ncbi:MAG: CRISPR-associated endonuclease Cas2 [Bacillota bacterium]|nr:CRISPR-associated endonuclease Cas2 [Bacillota bacterium]
MRSFLMFDLPTETVKQRKAYSKFVKFIKSKGFIMFQESVYMKLSINESAVEALTKAIKQGVPSEGFVAMLTITEKQFNSIDLLLGEFKSDILTTDDKVIEL